MRAVGLENLAPLFFHQLARTIKDPAEGVLLAKLAHEFDQPHASVRLSKIALNRGLPLAELAYPTNMFPKYKKINDPVEDALLYSLSRQESEFNPSAKSPVGARGLMQIMPGTAEDLDVLDRKRSTDSIFGGCRYLSQMLDQFDTEEVLALAAYNAGPGAVRKYGGVPPFRETRRYIISVARSWPERTTD